MVLNPQLIFGSPPERPTSLSSLLPATANAYASVLTSSRLLYPIEWMAAFCKGLCGGVAAVYMAVVSGRKNVEVLRVDTCPVPALVVDNHPLRDFSVSSVPSDSMSTATRPSEVVRSISILIQSQLPYPTTIRANNDSVLEGFDLSVCKVLHPLMYTGTGPSLHEVP